MKRINIILGNAFLPVVWMALTGRFSLANFAIGFGISAVCLWVISSPREVTFIVYVIRFYRFVRFVLFFIGELIIANLRVAHEVLTPGHSMRPAIVAVDLDLQSDLEITVLANFITLTPGTLSLDVSPDRKTLFVHVMHVRDIDAFRQDIKHRLERRVRELFE